MKTLYTVARQPNIIYIIDFKSTYINILVDFVKKTL